MPQNLSAQFVCLSPKVWDTLKKGFIGRPQSVVYKVENFNVGRKVVKKMTKNCQRSLQTPPNANGRNASLEIIFTKN